jgi:hypothetical protein
MNETKVDGRNLVSALGNLKSRLAKVRSTSWRYKLVKSIWGSRTYDAKACVFYWIFIPTSLLVYLGIAILYVILVPLILIVGTPIALIAGFYPVPKNILTMSGPPFKSYIHKNNEWRKVTNKQEVEYGYTPRYKYVKPTKMAPYKFMGPAIVGLLLLYAAFTVEWSVLSDIWQWIALGLGVGILIMVVAFLLQKNRSHVKSGWNKLCPDLEVVNSES